MGHTSFTKEEVSQAIAHLGRDFKGINYHLMNKNCNHFASELTQVTKTTKFLIQYTMHAYMYMPTNFGFDCIVAYIVALWKRSSSLGKSSGLFLNLCTIFGKMSS